MKNKEVLRSVALRGVFVAATSLALGSTAFAAPYTLELTGLGDRANNGTVYFSPYVGTVSLGGKQIYSGYLICDDFNTPSSLHDPWSATATNAGALDGSEKFAGATYTLGGNTYDTQQLYDAVGWLANQLLLPTNVHNSAAQGNYSFAIWDITSGQSASGDVLMDINDAFAAVQGGYVPHDIEVFTPDPLNAAQEFLVPVPEPSSLMLIGLGLAGMGLRFRTRRRS